MGAHIKGTNGKSQGVVPFLKVANDTAVAVNRVSHRIRSFHTADGIKAIRDVKAGDLVLGISGTYREVKRAPWFITSMMNGGSGCEAFD